MTDAIRIKGHEELDDSKMSYWHTPEGWMLYIPGCGVGRLSQHTVTEHRDGTITVTPSILMKGHRDGQPTERHGYLTKGVWSEC